MSTTQFEADRDKIVLMYPYVLGTAPSPASTGYQSDFTAYEVGEKASPEDFDPINTGGVPSEPVESTKPVDGTFTLVARIDDYPHWAANMFAYSTPTGVGPDYVHTSALGGVLADSFALEHHVNDSTVGAFPQSWGGRIATVSGTLQSSGAYLLEVGARFLREITPIPTSATATTITTFTDNRIDQQNISLEIDDVPTCKVVAFDWNLDYRLEDGVYPVGCADAPGQRQTLARLNPTLRGSLEIFASDEAFALIDQSKVLPKVPVKFTVDAQETAVRYIKKTIDNANLYYDGTPIQTSGGYNVKFTWAAHGSTALTCEVGNQTATYPTAP